MDSHIHTMSDLFAQLGLPDQADQIDKFIESVRPLASNVHVAEAALWSTSQAAFLKESLQQDSDWAELVDQLNMDLH